MSLQILQTCYSSFFAASIRSHGRRTFIASSPTFALKKKEPSKKETKLKVEAKAKLAARRAIKRAATNPEKMTIAEAAAVLRAVEVTTPWSAYDILVQTNFVRGSTPPRGRAKLPRDTKSREEVLVIFADGEQADQARAAGATYVGGAELIPQILDGTITPTKVLSTPKLLPIITPSLARFLGPKGLMPSEKRKTVVADISTGMEDIQGKLDWKADRTGVIRAAVARIHFPVSDVEANIRALMKTVYEATMPDTGFKSKKKASSSGIVRVLLSSRQGPSIQLRDV